MAKDENQIWPMSPADLAGSIRGGSADGSTLVFTAGMANWTAVSNVPQLRTDLTGGSTALPVPGGGIAHDIDFSIESVESELDPGESTVAEASGMMNMNSDIVMETIFGDGSQSQQSGFMDKLLGTGKRLITGGSLFMTVFTNTGGGKQRVVFAAPTPARFSQWI